MVTEGRKRGVSYQRIAELTSTNPASRFGLHSKGSIAPGKDADIALLEEGDAWTVRAEDSLSTQEYTPFEGFELTARVTDTFVRGNHVFSDRKIHGEPQGQYLFRPTQMK